MKLLIYWLAGKETFKSVMFWLIGEKAGRILAGIWNWLWGIPLESGGLIAVEVAKESLESMEKSVAQLTESVATVVAAYEAVKLEYELKHKEFAEAENGAILAHQRGNDEVARLAMGKAISIEKILPKIASKLEQSEKIVKAAKENLRQRREQLEIYKTEMHNLKSLAKINEALAKITDINGDLNLHTAQEQFESAQEAVQGRYLQVNAQVELSENPSEKLQSELDDLVIEEEISRRLAQLKDKN